MSSAYRQSFSRRKTDILFIFFIAGLTGSRAIKAIMIRYIFAFAACVAILNGQNATGITGAVKDPQGRMVSGAHLRLFRQDTRAALSGAVSDSGTFRFEDLTPGIFLLEAGREGFQTSTVTVQVEQGSLKEVNVTLPLAGVNQSVVVTAADQAQTVDEVSKAMTVVSHDEIINRNNYALSDILTTTPGLQIRNQGGPGQYTAMSVRGLPASAGAILVDGLRFRDAGTTQADATSFLSALNFVNADHIEVLRGSGSSLYGTNAVGGAVNVVSDQGGGPLHGDLQVEGGNIGFFRTRANIGGGAFGDRFKYSAGILHLNVMSGVDGQDANRSSGLQGFARYDLTPKMSLSGRFWGSDDFVQLNNTPTSTGIPFSNIPSTAVVSAIPLSQSGVRTLLAGGTPNFGNATYIPDANDRDDRRSSRFENAAFIFRDILTPQVNWQASYQLVHTTRVYDNGPLGIGYQPEGRDYGTYTGTIHTAGLRGTAQIAPWISLTGGYEFEREDYSDYQNNNLPAPQSIIERTHIQQSSNSGFFATQISLLDRRLQISLSGRAQNYNVSTPQFQYAGTDNPYANVSANTPSAFTGDASVAYLIAPSNTKLRAHVGNSYRAPSLYERFGAGFTNNFLTGAVVFTPYGDPRLSPDRYNSVDGGIDQYLFGTRLRVSATYFYTRIVQLINFNSNGLVNPVIDPFGRTSGYLNGAGGISRGAELSVEAHPMSSLTMSASYTYTNANTDQDSQVPGFFQVFDTPRHSVTLVVTKEWTRRIATTFDLFRYSSYYDAYVGYLQAYQFPGYGKSDLVASYKFWTTERKEAKVYGKVDNLFNQKYYVSGFLAPQATFVIGLGYSF
jgi:iron complex outermembrane receptor protein